MQFIINFLNYILKFISANIEQRCCI